MLVPRTGRTDWARWDIVRRDVLVRRSSGSPLKIRITTPNAEVDGTTSSLIQIGLTFYWNAVSSEIGTDLHNFDRGSIGWHWGAVGLRVNRVLHFRLLHCIEPLCNHGSLRFLHRIHYRRQDNGHECSVVRDLHYYIHHGDADL